QDELLEDVRPKKEVRSEESNQVESTGYKHFNSHLSEIGQAIPPGLIISSFVLDDKQARVLLVNPGGIDSKPVKNRRLEECLDVVAPLRQEDQQRGQNQEPDQMQCDGSNRDSMNDREDDTHDEKEIGHGEQQLVQFGALAEKTRENALERSHGGYGIAD